MNLSQNPSRRSMLMNETAFPGSAVNTIGFSLNLPQTDADVLFRAVRLASSGVWPEGDEQFRYSLTDTMPRARADAEWETLAETPMGGLLADFRVSPIDEGGSRLCARFHHVLLDGYAMCLYAQRVLDAVNGKRLSPVTNAPDPIEGEDDSAFWTEYFADVKNEPALMSGSPEGLRRVRYIRDLPRELCRAMEIYAIDNDLPVSAILTAAFALYLARAGQTPDAVFMMPRRNRAAGAEQGSIDCRTLVVPVRVRVSDEDTFLELCKKARVSGKLASAHKECGIDRILSALRNTGTYSGAPSEYTFNCYLPRLKSAAPFSLDMSMDGAMHNHLTLNITRFDGGCRLIADAREGVYDAEKTGFFLDSMETILTAALKPDAVVGDIPILGESERVRLDAMRGDSYEIDGAATIPSLFRDAVRRFADSPALYAGEVSYTYQQLDELSNRAANALLARGIRGGDYVMFKLRRDHRLIPILLGILKSGAAFIPVDPAYPADRIDYIQKNSGATALIENADMLETETAECPHMDADRLLSYEDSRDPMTSIPQPQPAYSIYTSGTTGRPKGVILSHRGIVNITRPENNPFNRDITRNARGIVATGSVCFDISLFEFFVPLLNGRFIELAPESAMADASALAELILRHGADILHCTPSRIAAYLRNKRFAEALGSVQAILSAGEALPGSLAVTLRDEYHVRVYNGYGPTETTIGATITEAGDDKTIGRPIANTGIMILDAKHRRLPFGMSGELYIYGDGVGIGYRNLPEMTAERFITAHGKRMYKTGDLGRFLPDGRILYHGRNDSQVKLRGLRIELPEIESSMLAFPGIAMACVQVRKIYGSEHLIGFYSAREHETVDPEALRAFLKGRLTFYMVPDILKELDTIPQTPGGKTDLRAVAAIPVEYVRVYRAPGSEYERAVCEAIGKVLGQEQVSADDNFFEIGGDSLHTAELVFEIGERIPGAKVSYEDVFKYPIPAQMAQYLYRSAARPEQSENPLAAIDYSFEKGALSGNVIPDNLSLHPLGNVLLTGATGFLGVHILIELLRHPDRWTNLYCLARPTRRQSAEKRLRSTLYYYAEDDFDGLIGSRVFALNGDISGNTIFADGFDGHIDTVINAAANVSHFAYDDKLDRVNTQGVRNLLDFCERQGAAFVQVSTISVGGVYRADSGKPLTLDERSLFVGQEIRNQYILSKYMAEVEALRACAEKGVPVKLMRVGNLQGRVSDGEFQMNRNTNAFTRQISSYVRMGMIPESLYAATVNFSPVDEVARMIVALAQTPAVHTVFHVYPTEEAPFKLLFDTLERLGHSVRVLPEEQFRAESEALRETKAGRRLLEGILVEKPDFRYRDTAVTADLTSGILKLMGLKWTPITQDYIEKYFRALEGLNMFDQEEEEEE